MGDDTKPGRFWIANAVVGTYKFTGAMDDVRVYNRALSPSEIQGLFTAVTP